MLLMFLTAAPLWIFTIHVVVGFVLAKFNRNQYPQVIVLGIVGLGNIPALCVAWRIFLSQYSFFSSEFVGGCLYTLLVYNAFGFVYFQLFNISETSLHMHVMLDILLTPALRRDELMRKYNVDSMIKVRLERLVAMGQLSVRDGRFYLRKKLFLHGAKILTFWQTILGISL